MQHVRIYAWLILISNLLVLGAQSNLHKDIASYIAKTSQLNRFIIVTLQVLNLLVPSLLQLLIIIYSRHIVYTSKDTKVVS